jgi:hypothetical protein
MARNKNYTGNPHAERRNLGPPVVVAIRCGAYSGGHCQLWVEDPT